jgi:hypothetical protein
MKTKESAKSKKQSVTLKDLKTRKNPKGGVFWGGGDTLTMSRSSGFTAVSGSGTRGVG